MSYFTKQEAETIRQAFRHLYWMVDHTRLTHDLDDAIKAARSMGGDTTIRHREAVVIKAFLGGFMSPKKWTAAGLHGCAEWWRIGVMAGARFRTDHYRSIMESAKNRPKWMDERSHGYKLQEVKRGVKARRMMRDAIRANQAAQDRYFSRSRLEWATTS